MDTGATSHMLASRGTVSSYFNLSSNKNVIVDSGHEIPICGYGQTTLSPLMSHYFPLFHCLFYAHLDGCLVLNCLLLVCFPQ